MDFKLNTTRAEDLRIMHGLKWKWNLYFLYLFKIITTCVKSKNVLFTFITEKSEFIFNSKTNLNFLNTVQMGRLATLLFVPRWPLHFWKRFICKA